MHRAFTLIEVLTAIVLTTTLLVGMLVGFQQHTRQLERAVRLVQDCDAIDSLLNDWFKSEQLPSRRQGQFAYHGDDYRWTRQVVDRPLGIASTVVVVRVSVQRIGEPNVEKSVSIDLLVVDEEGDGST